MNLFGHELDAQAIAGLVAMIATLVLWVGVLVGQRREVRWFKAWEARRRAEREDGRPAEKPRREGQGPWG